jgi:hypothetical protein
MAFEWLFDAATLNKLWFAMNLSLKISAAS